MKTKALPFGSTFEKKFKIGDLVYWFSWEERENYDIETTVHRGVLIDILHQKFGDREVSMAKVLPYGSTDTILINITVSLM